LIKNKLCSLLKKKKKKEIPTEKIEKEKFKKFLSQVNIAFVQIFQSSEGNTPEIRKRLFEEVKKWLDEMESFDSASFKAGCCYGAYQVVKRIKEPQKTGGDKYIA